MIGNVATGSLEFKISDCFLIIRMSMKRNVINTSAALFCTLNSPHVRDDDYRPRELATNAKI